MNSKAIAILCACTALLLVATVHAFAGRSADEFGNEAQWESRIRAVGGKAAYEEFATSVAALLPEAQHFRSHRFGEALYTVLGLDGIAVCDGRFIGGCFHQFMSEAMHDHGLPAVSQLATVCVREGSQYCAHGIGHGLVSVLGYFPDAREPALKGCDELPDEFRSSCYTGMFMEYELHTVLGGPPLALTPTNWYAPCEALDDRYSFMCAFYLPHWWYESLTSLGQDATSTALWIGNACEGSATETRRQACFLGAGSGFALHKSPSIDAVAALCRELSEDEGRRLLCTSSAVAFFVRTGRGSVENVCGEFAPPSLTTCITGARASLKAAHDTVFE